MDIDRRRRRPFTWEAETLVAGMLAAGMILLCSLGLNIAVALIAALPFSWLWNLGPATWLAAPQIHFGQAVCLLLLCRLLKAVSGGIGLSFDFRNPGG